MEILLFVILGGFGYLAFWGIYDQIFICSQNGNMWGMALWLLLGVIAAIIYVFMAIIEPELILGTILTALVVLVLGAFQEPGTHLGSEAPTPWPNSTALLPSIPTRTPPARTPTATPVPAGIPVQGCWLSNSREYFVPVRDRFGNMIQLEDRDRPIPCSEGHGTKVEGSWGTNLWCYCLEPIQALPQLAPTPMATGGCHLAAASQDPFWLVVDDDSSPVGWNWYQPGLEAGLVLCDPNNFFLPPDWTGLEPVYCQCGGGP